LNPRPEFIATRDEFITIKPIDPDYLRDIGD
jgi:hypothetical protein